MKKLIFISFMLCSFSCRHEPIIIVPFKVMNRVDTFYHDGKPTINRLDYFLIKTYKDNKDYDNYIDSFVIKNRPGDFAKYNQYSIILYKESDKTNLKGNPGKSNIIDKYSDQNDMVMDYDWFGTKAFIKHKIKNGNSEIDTSNKVKVIDLK